MPSIVLSVVFPQNTSDERFIGTPRKEVLYLDVGMAKYFLCFQHKTGRTVFAKSTDSVCLLKILQFFYAGKKNAKKAEEITHR